MMTYQNSVSSGKPEVLTVEKWNELIDSPRVKNICKTIAGLDPKAADYNDRKQALKKRLPIIIPHAASFTGGRRVSAEAIPSGLAMLDVDHVENPREWFETLQRETIIENHIFLVAITASGKGLRIIGARAQGETIEAAQMRMAQALGIEEYDAVTKDLARASYVVPREYILWMDQTELFAEREWKDEPSLTEAASEETGESETETYRGIPYADIVDELMVQMGIAGGAEQGERNTSLFALANYMRYICDFNAEVLLRVLPAFGLTEQERKQVITSAIGRPRKSQIPLILQADRKSVV